jgi:hypothetical protein
MFWVTSLNPLESEPSESLTLIAEVLFKVYRQTFDDSTSSITLLAKFIYDSSLTQTQQSAQAQPINM